MNRKSSKRNTNQSPAMEEDHSITQKDELPGVDYKNKLGPRSLRHNRLNLNTPTGESRFLHSVSQELSKKSNVHKLQNAFQQTATGQNSTSTALSSKMICLTNQDIAINMSCPLDDISVPSYINKWKNPELIQEIPQRNLDDGEADEITTPEKIYTRPTVLAVNLKWRNGIQVKQCHKFTTRTLQLEPIMRKTEFDYETKTKFSKEVELACEELFPDWRQKLMILDGNESHGMYSSSGGGAGGGDSGKTAKAARSDKLSEDSSPAPPYTGSNGDPHTREWKEFTDMEEHQILVVPSHTKGGFDMDLSKHYQFPYQAKFVIGRKVYHHKFILRLPVSKSPQHYGLIFTFSEDANGHSKLRIKSLLSVYNICPHTTKYACLETYETNEKAIPDQDLSMKTRSRTNQSARAAKNAVQLLSDNLKEEKVVNTFCNNYQVSRDLPQAAQDHFRFRRLYDEAGNHVGGNKQKKKQQMQRSIKSEQARY